MSAHPDRLRVISMNLANGRAAPSAIERLVDALDPDVVAVQELSAAQARVLERRFPHGKLDPAHDSMGMGIALRHPGTVWRLPLSYRDACVAELPSPTGVGRDTEIVNVHIAAPHIQPLWRTLARRRRQLRALEAHLEASRRPAHLAAAREAPSTRAAARPCLRASGRQVDPRPGARQREGRHRRPSAGWPRGSPR